MEYIVVILMGYLLGTSSMSFYLGKLKGINVKKEGTGNLGASNTMMLMGWKAGAIVAIHDALKAVVAVWLAKYFFSQVPYASYLAGASCIIGHIFPFYLGFKGGKGLASYVGLALGLHPIFAIALLVVGILITVITDYIVLATLTVMVVVPVFFTITDSYVAGLILCAPSIVMVFKHKENIQRILNGTEVGLRSANRGEHRIGQEK